LGNAVTGQISSFVNSAQDAITSGGGTAASNTDVDDLVSQINLANDTKEDTTTGGLTAVSNADLSGVAGTSGADDKGDTTLDTSTLTSTSTGAGGAGTSDLFGAGADDSFTLTGGSDIKAGTGDTDEDEDATVGGLNAASTAATTGATTGAETAGVADTTGAGTTGTGKPVTGGLTQAQKDLIDAGNVTNVSSAADAATVGGLNQLTTDQVADTGATSTGATTAGTAAGTAAGTNLVSNLIKNAVTSTATGTAKNAINKAAGLKTKPMPSAASRLTGSALSALRSNVVPTKVDVSKLIPKQVAKRTAPVKVDVSKLTPVSNISGLTALIKGKG
jgi:hypothetical protein